MDYLPEFNARQEADYVLGMMEKGIASVKADPGFGARFNTKMILGAIPYFLYIGIFQTGFGLYRYIVYTKKIRNIL